jgi:glycosyltransferase involved in cell wall biosynthesis
LPCLDIIVPCYGYGHFLRECVESVLSQSLADLRVMIIDDASPDDAGTVAAALAASDRRVEVITHERNWGHIGTYNDGIARATADYLLLLSADDHLLPGALARAVSFMDRHPEVGFTYGRALEGPAVDPATAARYGGARGRWTIEPSVAFIRRSSAFNLVPTPTAVVRTALHKQVGGYRPELPHSGDMELWLRLAARAPVAHTSSYQALQRVHECNMSKAYGRGLADQVQKKAALDLFFASGAAGLQERARLRREALKGLAADTVSRAGAAFVAGDPAHCAELLDYAVLIDRDITHSPIWRRVVWQQRLGRHLAGALIRLYRTTTRASALAIARGPRAWHGLIS